MPLFGKKKSSEPLPPIDDAWTILRGEHEGSPLLVRRNKGLEAVVGHPDYRTRLRIAIPLNEPDERGFPSERELGQLGDIEDRLFDVFRRDDYGLPAVAITTSGVREYVMYVRDGKAAEGRLVEVSSTIASHRFQLIVQDDKKWDVYRQFAGS